MDKKYFKEYAKIDTQIHNQFALTIVTLIDVLILTKSSCFLFTSSSISESGPTS